MTWAYEKAQESQEADDPSASNKKDGFRKVAVVAILRSLSSEEQRLDRLQKDAVESIASIFDDAEEPAVRASVAQLYESIGKPSPYLERELYADRLGAALKDIPLIKRTFRDVRTPDGRHLHDWALETTDGSIAIIECARDARGLHLLPALARTVGRAWAGADVVPAALRGATVSKAMLIYGGTQIDPLEWLSENKRTRIEDVIDKELGVVHWDPDAGAVGLVTELTAFLTN